MERIPRNNKSVCRGSIGAYASLLSYGELTVSHFKALLYFNHGNVLVRAKGHKLAKCFWNNNNFVIILCKLNTFYNFVEWRHKQNSLELWNQARLFMKDNCQSSNKRTDAKQTTNRICVGKFWINKRSCCKPQVMKFNYKYEIYNSHLARHSLAPARFIFHVNSSFFYAGMLSFVNVRWISRSLHFL